MAKLFKPGDFLKALAEGSLVEPIVREGMVKPDPQDQQAFLFSEGSSGGSWIKVPVEAIESIEFLYAVMSKDHEHHVVRLQFKEPPKDNSLATFFAGLARFGRHDHAQAISPTFSVHAQAISPTFSVTVSLRAEGVLIYTFAGSGWPPVNNNQIVTSVAKVGAPFLIGDGPAFFTDARGNFPGPPFNTFANSEINPILSIPGTNVKLKAWVRNRLDISSNEVTLVVPGL